jgi:Alternative complex III, ActD subunit
MAEKKTLLALFGEVDPAAEAIEKLRSMGVPEDQMEVISGVPILAPILGRPRPHTSVSRLALGGAAVGFLFGLFLNFGVPFLFPLHIGGQPVFPIPPGIILTFEMTMLGLMGLAFLGVFLESYFPKWRPLEYVPEISDGKVAVLFSIPADEEEKFTGVMKDQGAESIGPATARQL